MKQDLTINYYNEMSQEFIDSTVNVDFKVIDKKFQLSFNPQEVKTIKLCKDGTIREIRIIEF